MGKTTGIELNKTIPVEVIKDQERPAEFSLVERVANGKYREKDFTIVRGLIGLTIQIKFIGMTATIEVGGEIEAILDEMLQLDVPTK